MMAAAPFAFCTPACVRQRRGLRTLPSLASGFEEGVASGEPWVVPFVGQLAGEYGLEILEAIARGLPGPAGPGSAQRRLYGEFIARNPAFFARTERRVVSYWSCYYRWKYGAFGTYPGCVLLEAFRAAVVEQVGAQWPRHTPRPAGGRG